MQVLVANNFDGETEPSVNVIKIELSNAWFRDCSVTC